MRIRGFAMMNGVSFTDGKRRVTGRILADGNWEIREGGRWYWRFSARQVLAMMGIVAVASFLYFRPEVDDWRFTLIFLLLLLPLVRLSRNQRRFHGAEHTAVNLWEGRVPSVLHPGCGSNLVLMLLPGLLLEFLPFSFWVSILCEMGYLLVIYRLIWPFWIGKLRRGSRLAQWFWQICRVWQRLFVSEPREDEIRLAVRVLEYLFNRENANEEI